MHEAEQQFEGGHIRDHIAVDETTGDRLTSRPGCTLPSAEIDGLRHTEVEPASTKALAHAFVPELCDKHDGDDVLRTAQRFSWPRKPHSDSRTARFSSTVRARWGAPARERAPTLRSECRENRYNVENIVRAE